MSAEPNSASSRRKFLKSTGCLAAGTALAGAIVPRVHAAENGEIQVALVGAGGRGTGAAADALAAKGAQLKLVAVADVFENRVQTSIENLKREFGDRADVPKERQFIGFDAYRKALDCLKPGDIAIFATPPAFRWVHFGYAIEKGLNVFMEKPVTVDGPTSHRMFKLAEASEAKNLKVGVGLMSRHSRAMQELADRIHGGEIGDLILMRAYRMHGPGGSFQSLPKPQDANELLYQIQRFHSFLWASGGCFSDFYIHVIDHCCWMKNAWPVKAQALGGRHYRQGPEGVPWVDQNFDIYAVEYTFADETKLLMDGRCMGGCFSTFNSFAHGTKGVAVISRSGDCGPPSATFSGLAAKRSNLLWQSKGKPGEGSPYRNEWNDLVDAIVGDKPYNEAKRGIEASLVTSMGRMAAHTGREVTYEDMLNCDFEMAPGIDQFTMDSPAPLQAGPDGRYPVPQPGLLKREY